MKIFPDYQEAVLRYLKSRETVSSNLMQPTPASLRDECFLVCSEGFNRKDEHILRIFFGKAEDKNQYLKLIERCDIDRLKPLANFLKKTSIKTNVRNVELLAWLIDFKYRPYESWKENSVEDEISYGTTLQPTKETTDENSIKKDWTRPEAPKPVPDVNNSDAEKSPRNKKNNLTLKNIGIYIGVVFLAASGLYIYYISTNHKPTVMGNTFANTEACMYWTGDHYEQVSCNNKIKDAFVIALDSFKLLHFKRITAPDTITYQHIGRIWYIKTDGNIEFYTSEGAHPLDMKKRLKPITSYIINKYILSKTN